MVRGAQRVQKQVITNPCTLHLFSIHNIFDSSNIYDNIVARVWQILCGYQPAGRGEEVVRRKREEYAGYVDQYFNNKEEDIHKDTFR